ncbi:phosphotransferase family protein [Novosphingobium sp. HII-3]|uniref:phosphotransferase family protein n=1 Tax=Novosphingobium sp. HII-3 TaxID=2075565 RepID=UPI0013049B7D|nr:phosphotransferase family protein [Novosphingobium sp. HII-3]
MDATQAGDQIVRISRKARLADTTDAEWTERLTRLIAAQRGLSNPVVLDVRPVGTAAGGSNGTLLFNATYDSPEGRIDKALVLRFLPGEGLFHRYDVREQFMLQRALEDTSVPVPSQLWLDAEAAYLARPGYVMEQCEGESSAMAWMTDGIIADASSAERREMSLNYVRSLAAIHSVDWRAAGLHWLENRAAGSKPIEREANWYWDSLIWSGDEAYRAGFGAVRDWLIANEPTDIDIVLCHGDANFGNYLYKGTQVSAVLDWEMAFLGAPEADLAFLKVGDSILLSGVAFPHGVLTYEEMRAEYERISGRTLKHIDYFELFAIYRLGIINVLAMKHFPVEMLEALLPVFRRGPDLCFAKAASMGVNLPAIN